MLKLKLLAPGSLAVGVKEYEPPACTEVDGVPLMVGGGTAAAAILIEKAGSDTVLTPSETLIVIPEYVPTFALDGVPLNCPVDVLKLAHEGLAAMENVSVLPSGSEAAGSNE